MPNPTLAVSPPSRPAPRFVLPLRLALSLVFLVAVMGKVLDFNEFLRSVAAIGWVPEQYAGLAAVILLGLEVLAAVLLLLPATFRFGAGLSAVLAVLFCAVTSSLLLQGVEGDCSCFGVFLKLPRSLTLFVDAALLLGSLALLRNPAPAAVSSSHARSSGRLLLLSSIFLLLSLSLLALIKSNDDLRLQFGAMLPGIQTGLFAYRPERDPKAGQPAPEVGLKTAQGQPMNGKFWGETPVLLLFVGRCGNCSLRRVQTWTQSLERSAPHRLIVVTTDDAKGASWLAGKLAGKAVVARDEHRTTTYAYNAMWTPRAYLVGTRGELIYCQPRSHDLTRAAEVVGGILKNGRFQP